MDKLNAYHALSIEDANMVDRYAKHSSDPTLRDHYANLVLELRAQQPPVTIRALNEDRTLAGPSESVRIDPARSSFRVEI